MKRVMNLIRMIAPPLIAVTFILVAWQIAVMMSGVSAFLVPSPLAIGQTMWASSDRLIGGAIQTAMASTIGFVIAAVIGILVGSMIAAVPFLRRSLYPLATILQMVPLVAVAPLLVIWLGFGLPTAIAAATVVAVFPVLAATIDGQVSVDPGLREFFLLHGASAWTRWRKLDLPASIPAIVTGLRIAAGLAVIGAIVGEFVSGYGGPNAPLGIVIMTAMREARTDLVFAAIALSAVVGFALFGAVSCLGWLLVSRWHASGVNSLEQSK